MKKFSKLLAVLLTIAVVICPMTSAIVANATAPAGGYSLTVINENTAALTITSEDGFLVYMATVQITDAATKFDSSYNSDGYANGLKVIDYTLKAGSAGTVGDGYTDPVPSANLSGNNLTFIVSANDQANLDLYTSVTIYIHLTGSTTVALTNLQAADEGTVEEDPTLLSFGTKVASDGTVSQSENPAATPAATHNHDTAGAADVVTAPGCTTTGSYYATCSVCSERQGELQTSAALGHDWQVASTTPATCTEAGNTHYTCSRCDATKDEAITALGHNLTHHAAQAATCTAAGNSEYWSCDRCSQYFSDENAAETIAANSWIIGATGHNLTHHAAQAATCTAAGNSEYWSCDGCNQYFSDENATETIAANSWVIAATGVHTPSNTETTLKTAATCTADAVYYQECSVCHAQLETTWTKTGTATGHSLSYLSNGNGTHTVSCSNEGCPGGFETSESCDTEGEDGACSKCGYKAAEAECEHTYELLSIVPATDSSTGTITFKCSKCEDTQSSDILYKKNETVATPAVGCTSTTQLILPVLATRFSEGKTYLILTHHFANGADDYTEILDADQTTVVDGKHQWVIGVKTTNFSDVFDTTVAAYLDGAWRSGDTRAFSIKALAEGVVTTGATDAEKMAAANLLNMGAKIQLAFGQATDALADAGLTGELDGYVIETKPSIVKTEGTNWFVDNSDAAANGKVAFASPQIVLSDAISIAIRANVKNYAGDKTNLKIVATYTAFNGADVEKEITSYTVSGNNYTFALDMNAPDMRTAVTIQAYVGDTAVSNAAVYSIESVFANMYASLDAAQKTAVDAVMNYSDAALAYFG